jgi:hypothetical protein
MALVGANERIQNYSDKLIPVRVQEDLTTKKPSMVALVTVIFNEQSTIEDRVKGVLSGEAVNSISYPWYHAFSREVWKAQRRFGGGTALVNEVALLVYKWKTRGMTEAILDKIRDEVFAIPAPPAP